MSLVSADPLAECRKVIRSSPLQAPVRCLTVLAAHIVEVEERLLVTSGKVLEL